MGIAFSKTLLLNAMLFLLWRLLENRSVKRNSTYSGKEIAAGSGEVLPYDDAGERCFPLRTVEDGPGTIRPVRKVWRKLHTCLRTTTHEKMDTRMEEMQTWVEDFLTYQAAQRGALPRTIDTYRVVLKYAMEYFVASIPAERRCMWDAFGTDDLRSWVAEQMQRGCAPAYVRRNVATLRSFYRFLLREKRVKTDPARLLKAPKQPRRLPTFVKESELDRLFEYYPFGDGYEGIRDRTMLLMLYHTGMRSAELLGLQFADLNMAENSLKVTGKGDKQRVIPFGKELADTLYIYIKEWREFMGVSEGEGATLPLFVNSRRRRFSYNELLKLVHEALGAVTTQKKKSPHVLRHSFATAMLANGAQLEVIQQLLGHASVATTAIYTHTTLAELKDQYRMAHPRNDSDGSDDKGE